MSFETLTSFKGLRNTWKKFGFAALFTACFLLAGCPAPLITSIVTYHYDNYRSGWNSNEGALTPAKVSSSSFGQLYNIALDDQVDTQPLLAVVKTTAGSNQGVHNVLYVATENNTIYMIDSVKGTVLHHKNFGTPVSSPLGCNNNGPNVGINGTPVIDLKNLTLYVITYTMENGNPVYRLHALDMGDLKDKMTSVVVSASHTLSDGHTVLKFDAKYQRQRPGLLLANGNIYAGFGSFCDWGGSNSRGWVLGWKASTLAPLAANQMNDTQTSEPDGMFLSSVWMSGSGLAADDAGNIYFVTGNSDKAGTTYDGVTNIQESVVKASANLTSVLSLFTPSDQASLDAGDTDYGSGGVVLLPTAPATPANSAAAAGKNGQLYMLDLSSLGGKSATGIGGTPVSIGECWCAQSTFSDGTEHLVSSGASTVMLWNIKPSPVSITQAATSAGIGGAQDGGFFTTVSSNGTDAGSDLIIWAISRPNSAGSASSPAPITLWAFKGKALGYNPHHPL